MATDSGKDIKDLANNI